MEKINYTSVPVDINEEKTDYEIVASKEYIILLSAPAAAKVYIKLNSKDDDLIPLKENFAINAKGVEKIFITCNAVPGEKLLFGTSKTADDFQIITAPVVKDIESIAKLGEVEKFSAALLAELDKIVNPYEYVGEIKGVYKDGGELDLLNTTLSDCDKIVISLLGTYGPSNQHTFYDFFLTAYIDNVARMKTMCQGVAGTLQAPKIETFENVRDSNLRLHGFTNNNGRELHYSIKKYKLKA